MILPCGHSLCQSDLQLLVHSASSSGTPPRCPSCKGRFHHHKNGEQGSNTGGGGATRNYALQQLLENAKVLHGGISPQAIPKCPVHPMGILEFWCQECGIGVCPKCYLLQHKGHTMIGLEEAFKGQGQQTTQEALDLGLRAMEKAEERLTLMQDRRARLLAAQEAAKRDIVCHFDKVK